MSSSTADPDPDPPSLSRYAIYHGLALAADLASLALVGLGTLFFMDVDPLGLATGKLIQSHICPGISFFIFLSQ